MCRLLAHMITHQEKLVSLNAQGVCSNSIKLNEYEPKCYENVKTEKPISYNSMLFSLCPDFVVGNKT